MFERDGMEVKDVNRVYSTMVIKAVDESKREITGIASTPGTDRVGDIVEPSGAEFILPVPLLWQHDHSSPIGNVTQAKVTSKGIEIKAALVKPTADMPSQMFARLEEAWQSIKTGLVRGLSIGFSAIEYSLMEQGVRYLRWNWHELSAVTIPANAEATITAIKSMDETQRAASGTKPGEVRDRRKALSPGDSGKQQSVKPKLKGNSMKTNQERLAALEASRQEKALRMEAIIKAADERGETMDAEEGEEYDGLVAEVARLDQDISRVKSLEALQVEKAKEGNGRVVEEKTKLPVQVKKTEVLEPGISFARMARVLALSSMKHMPQLQIAQAQYPNDTVLHQAIVNKTAVPAANTLNTSWAGKLVTDGGTPFADFIEFLRPRTLLGRIEDRLRRIPFNTPVAIQTSGGTGYWTKEGTAKNLTQWGYNTTKLQEFKVATIAAATKEMLNRASMDVDRLIRDELARAISARIDLTFLSDTAGVPDTSPAGILNSVSPTTLSGSGDSDGVRCDVETMMNVMTLNNNSIAGSFWVMPEQLAIALSLMQNPLGQVAFPGINFEGGTFFGLPVFVTQYADTDSDGSLIALIKGDEVFFGDEGGIDVSVSDQASLLMDNAANASMDSTTPTAAQLVSMWQTNSVAFRVERYLSWSKRRSQAVVWGRVNWTSCVTP